jgi:hypothetical protein
MVLTKVALLVVALAAAALPSSSAGAAREPAHFHTFVRDWMGHTRGLQIRRDHTATETIDEGGCTHVVTLQLVLDAVRGSTEHASVRARVTQVQVDEPSFFDPQHPAPAVGDVARLKLRHGVLHEPLTGVPYCDQAADVHGRCGA